MPHKTTWGTLSSEQIHKMRLSPRRAARTVWTWRGAVSLAGASVVRSLLSSVVSHSLRSARQNEPLLPPRAGAASEARRAAPRPIGRHLPERAVEGRLACRRWLQEVPPNGELPTNHQTNKRKVVAIMVNNCTKKNAHAASFASARQHSENKEGKPGRPFAGARGGGPTNKQMRCVL